MLELSLHQSRHRYEKLAIGSAAFWFGFVTLILLLILVTYRYVTVKEVPDPAKPLICIYAAPTSLCIARICAVCHAEILRISDGNVCSCNGDLHLCTCKSNWLFEDAILPKLCGIHLPICHQCDRFKTDDGMCNEYGTSDAVPEICGIDRDDYCGCSGCVYIYSFYGIYLWREEIS